MALEISHPCLTFVQEVWLWKVKQGTKFIYYPYDETPIQIRESERSVRFVTNPTYKKGDSIDKRFKEPDPMDLVISCQAQQEIEHRQKQVLPGIISMLDKIFLDTLRQQMYDKVIPLLNQQVDFYFERKGEKSYFIQYVETLLENNQEYAIQMVRDWITENNPISKDPSGKKITSARQLAITLHFLEETGRIKLPTTDQFIKAKFLEFLSGTGNDNIDGKMSSLGDYSFKNFSTPDEKRSLRRDLEKVREKFRELGFFVEVGLIDQAILKLNAAKKAG